MEKQYELKIRTEQNLSNSGLQELPLWFFWNSKKHKTLNWKELRITYYRCRSGCNKKYKCIIKVILKLLSKRKWSRFKKVWEALEEIWKCFKWKNFMTIWFVFNHHKKEKIQKWKHKRSCQKLVVKITYSTSNTAPLYT